MPKRKENKENSRAVMIAIIGAITTIVVAIITGMFQLLGRESPSASTVGAPFPSNVVLATSPPLQSPLPMQSTPAAVVTPIKEGETWKHQDVLITLGRPVIWSVEPDGTWQVRIYWKFENRSGQDVVLKYDTGNFSVRDNFGQIRSTPGSFGCISQDRVIKPGEVVETFQTDTGCRLFIKDDSKIDEIFITAHNVFGIEQAQWRIGIPNFPPFRP